MDLKTRAGFPVKQYEHKHLKDTFAELGRARETEREEDWRYGHGLES